MQAGTAAAAYWNRTGGFDRTVAMLVQFNALFAGAIAVTMVARLAREEVAGRTGLVVSTPTGRLRWLVSGAVVTGGWSLLTLVWTGALLGLGLRLGLGEPARLGQGILATLQYAPAVALVLAASVALAACWPRATPAGWALIAWGFVVALRGDMLNLPQWERRLSPLEWIGLVPIEDYRVSAAVGLAALAVLLVAAALPVFRRRDLLAG